MREFRELLHTKPVSTSFLLFALKLIANGSANVAGITDPIVPEVSIKEIQNILQWISVKFLPRVGSIRFIADPNKIDLLSASATIINERHFPVINGLEVKYPRSEISSAILVILEDLNSDFDTWSSPLLPNKTSLHQWIKVIANRRRDHVIFVGTNSIIYKYWQHPILNQLTWKWALDEDTQEIFASVSGHSNPLLPTHFKDVKSLEKHFKVHPTIFKMAHNVRGRKLKFTAWPGAPPYYFISGVNPDGTEIFDGTHYRIFNESFQKFNYTMNVEKTSGDVYGDLLPNGTWVGMIGNLYYEERGFDVCMYLGPQIFWYDLFDFSESINSVGVYFITVQMGVEIQWEAFLHPFQLKVWIMLVASYLLIFIFIHISIVQRSNTKTFSNPDGERWYLSISIPFKIALEQNVKIEEGSKFVTIVWLFVILITGAAYRTEIISALTFPTPTKVPSNNAELAAAKDFTVILNNIGEVETSIIETSELPAIQELKKRIIYQPNMIECISDIIIKPKTVCFAWDPIVQLIATEICTVDPKIDLYVRSTEALASTPLATAFKKDSNYIDGFNPIILAFFESGIYNLWEADIILKKKMKGYTAYKNSTESPLTLRMKGITDELKDVTVRKPLKMVHLKMMFCILFVGLFAACISFITEITELAKKLKRAIPHSVNNSGILLVKNLDDKNESKLEHFMHQNANSRQDILVYEEFN
ncbi:unnamed protein product [Orchesella dallaii]|uniref:Uncharacterized protein n=1 Tax=Orchesella dallaii TaxID=48710 RepID=A0ABP1QN99_9HEXA